MSIQVRSRSSVAGRIVASIPSAWASRAGHGGERLAGAQRLRPHEVEPEIAVAEPEPVLAAERGDGGERLPGLSGAAPASLLVVQAGERVEDAVEVGRDREAEHVEVVADVPDHRHAGRIDGADEPAREAGAADAAGEERDLHSASSRPIAACVRGPARRPIRARSSSVSTSSARFGIAAATRCDPVRLQRGRGNGRRCERRRAGRRATPAEARARSSSRPRPRRARPPRARRRRRACAGRAARRTGRRRSRRAPAPFSTRSSAATTASPWPPPGSSTISAPSSSASARASASSVTRSVRSGRRRTRSGRRRASRARASTEPRRMSSRRCLPDTPRKGTTICAMLGL